MLKLYCYFMYSSAIGRTLFRQGSVSWGLVPRKSCSSGTGRRDVYAIHLALVYASTSLVSGPNSICLSIYFLLLIHYHSSQASQTETLGLVFRVRCHFSYISFFYYYKARSLSIPIINTMRLCGCE